tara:strand:- start:745 stop:1596 length:852 start_codon:yes stop_codon:yes gene_type:complete
MAEIQLYRSKVIPDWCPGCGDFGVLNGIQKAIASLDIKPKDVLIVSGIGCSSNLPHYVNTYGFHSIHGRSIPVATGAKLANKDLTVIAVGGDGDGYGIGLGHLVHGMRRNLNLTYIVMNNGIYGLTTGQASPTSSLDMSTKSTPGGVIESPINPIPLAIVSGATFVGRAFSGDTNHMSELVANGITHNGFSMIDVFSPCVTYNKINTYDWYRNKVYKVEDDYDPTNFESAIKKSYEYEDRIPTGLIYKADKPTYEEQDSVLSQAALLKQDPIKLNDQSLDEFR